MGIVWPNIALYNDIFSFRKDQTFLTSFKLFCPSNLLCGSLTLPIPISYVVFSLRSLKCHEIMWFFVHTLEQRQTFPMLISSWTTDGARHLALHVTAYSWWFHWRSSTTITVSWKFHYSVPVFASFLIYTFFNFHVMEAVGFIISTIFFSFSIVSSRAHTLTIYASSVTETHYIVLEDKHD